MKNIIKLEELFKGTELNDLDIAYSAKEADNTEDFIEALEEQIEETEVIYYSNAMEYLSQNDASLMDSLSIATEMGYTTDKLNSELLATLLQQQNLKNKLFSLRNKIEDIFNLEE